MPAGVFEENPKMNVKLFKVLSVQLLNFKTAWSMVNAYKSPSPEAAMRQVAAGSLL